MYIYLIVHTAYIQSCVCHTDLKECSTTIQGYLAGPEQSRIEHLMENTCRTQSFSLFPRAEFAVEQRGWLVSWGQTSLQKKGSESKYQNAAEAQSVTCCGQVFLAIFTISFSRAQDAVCWNTPSYSAMTNSLLQSQLQCPWQASLAWLHLKLVCKSRALSIFGVGFLCLAEIAIRQALHLVD